MDSKISVDLIEPAIEKGQSLDQAVVETVISDESTRTIDRTEDTSSIIHQLINVRHRSLNEMGDRNGFNVSPTRNFEKIHYIEEPFEGFALSKNINGVLRNFAKISHIFQEEF